MQLLTEDALVVCTHELGIVKIIATQTLVTIGRRKVLVEIDPHHSIRTGRHDEVRHQLGADGHPGLILAVLPGDLPEILDDFLGISQAESYELADEEEDEAAYTELMEYVRISAQLFCEELRVQSTSSPPTTPTGGQLH